MVKMFFKALAKNLFDNIKKLFMTDILSNGLHEKVMMLYYCFITKRRLDVQFVRKIPPEMAIGQQI